MDWDPGVLSTSGTLSKQAAWLEVKIASRAGPIMNAPRATLRQMLLGIIIHWGSAGSGPVHTGPGQPDLEGWVLWLWAGWLVNPACMNAEFSGWVCLAIGWK